MHRYRSSFLKPKSKAFTLVELLIVVTILALLSAIIIPYYSDTVEDSKLSILKSNLVLMRAAITRYKIEHRDWPGRKKSSGGACSNGGSAGTGNPNKTQSLSDQLGFYTNLIGNSCSTRDSTYKYGPYLRDQQIPANPFSESNNVIISIGGELGLTSARVDGQGGWIYDVRTGQFITDDTAYDDL